MRGEYKPFTVLFKRFCMLKHVKIQYCNCFFVAERIVQHGSGVTHSLLEGLPAPSCEQEDYPSARANPLRTKTLLCIIATHSPRFSGLPRPISQRGRGRSPFR